jgi:hypothetical protein
MAIYQKFLVKETDRFDSSNFPQLETIIEQIVSRLNREPAGPKAEMLLSSVKDNCINSKQVVDHPTLATLISTKALPLDTL